MFYCAQKKLFLKISTEKFFSYLTKYDEQVQKKEVEALSKAAFLKTLISFSLISKICFSKLGSQAYSFNT